MPRILCNAKECQHYKDLEKPEKLHYGTCSESLSDYKGECTRSETGIMIKEVDSIHTHHTIPECMGFSRKNITGHFDWMRFPKGGHVDDDYSEKLWKTGQAKKL